MASVLSPNVFSGDTADYPADSAIFALLIAIVWLREPFTRLRLFAVVLSAGAVPLLRFA